MGNKTDIIWLDSTDSTNKEARRQISALDNLSVLSAVTQTDGRGQQGNAWSSASGDNLTFSIVLKNPGIDICDQIALSAIASLSITDLLSSYGIEAKIKWPNDIYVGDMKICGILIENALKGDKVDWSIIGIGLNVNQTDFPSDLPNPTSMVLCTRGTSDFDIRLLLEEFMAIFKGYHKRYLNINGGLKKLRQLYLSQLWRKGDESFFIDKREGRDIKFKGTITGTNDSGMLTIKNEEGELCEFAFKELIYII